MSRSPFLRLVRCCMLTAGVPVLTSCAGPTETPVSPNFARAAAGPAVTSADPSYGYQGDVLKTVTVTGSGFVNGAQASWERGGGADPKLQVSTQFVSSTQLVATITIAPDAAIDFYDVSVTNPDRKKGIGYSLFQVTQATVVAETTVLRNANSSGELVGMLAGSSGSQNVALYYSLGTGLVTLSTGAAAWAIDEAGKTISGNTNGGSSLPIRLWSLSGGSWLGGALPVDPTAAGGNGRGIASDPVTGTAAYIAGIESFVGKKGGGRRPRVWRLGIAGWERVLLPSVGTDGSDVVEEISQDGVAVGTSAGHAVVWTPDGAGGYTVAALPGVANSANGINSAGDIIVGAQNGGLSYYWTLQGVVWSAARSLPISCKSAVDVDDAGRIVANDCVKSSTQTLPAVFLPPYTGTPIWLGGLEKNSPPHVEAMSLANGWIAGQVTYKGATSGAYWKID